MRQQHGRRDLKQATLTPCCLRSGRWRSAGLCESVGEKRVSDTGRSRLRDIRAKSISGLTKLILNDEKKNGGEVMNLAVVCSR